MPDNGIRVIFIFFQELFGPRKSNLIDIFVFLLGCHSYFAIRYCHRPFIFINRHCDIHRA